MTAANAPTVGGVGENTVLEAFCLLGIGVPAGATPASRSPPGSNRASEGKLELQGSRGERGSPPAATMGGEKQATVSIVMSADSAQRLRAQAAESGLHQSDSGLASKPETNDLVENLFCSLVCLCIFIPFLELYMPF